MGSAQAAGRTLVAGVDSSTQSCKVVIRDADTGELLRTGQAPHPAGTQVDPRAWLTALDAAVFEAGGFADVSAIGVGAQQHGMVTLDEAGDPVRPAMLWNDLASAGAAADLTAEFGGAAAWAAAVGLVPVASFTATKLRWLRTNEPANAERTAAVCLPHDWLTWQLGGARGIDTLTTDRSDVSGTAYWSPDTGYRDDLLDLAFGGRPVLPRVLGPHGAAAETSFGARLSPGAGDNAASALGLGARPGDVIVSIGTSGVACAVSEAPTRDPSGTVAGFSDATGRYLPLIATVNAARVLDATAKLLGVNHEGLTALALQAPAGCGGLVLVPYLEGERTPDRPRSTGSLLGLRLDNMAPSYLARAAVEGLLCGLADALDALRGQGVELRRILLIGGAARSGAVRALAPVVLGYPVLVPEPGNHVADGAARQAAWLLRGGDEAPPWAAGEVTVFDGTPDLGVRDRYREARDLTLERLG